VFFTWYSGIPGGRVNTRGCQADFKQEKPASFVVYSSKSGNLPLLHFGDTTPL
jgi:hypothetical protein